MRPATCRLFLSIISMRELPQIDTLDHTILTAKVNDTGFPFLGTTTSI